MDLTELQSVRDRERQTDKLQQLRESFYADAGRFIQQLRSERDRAVERADDPFDSAEVRQLSDEIKTTQQTIEAIYEKRVGKIVKAASFAAADLPAEVDGMTAEEQALFDNLVGNIKDNRQHVLALLDGDDPANPEGTDSSPANADPSASGTEPPVNTRSESPTEPDHPNDTGTGSRPEPGLSESDASDGVAAADVMGSADPSGEGTYGQPDTGAGASDSESNPDSSITVSEGPDTALSPETESVPPSSEPVDPPVRKDGGQDTSRGTESETQSGADAAATSETIDRQRVQILEDVDTFLGFDDRDYDLESNDVVSLPSTNADILLERGVAREL